MKALVLLGLSIAAVNAVDRDLGLTLDLLIKTEHCEKPFGGVFAEAKTDNTWAKVTSMLTRCKDLDAVDSVGHTLFYDPDTHEDIWILFLQHLAALSKEAQDNVWSKILKDYDDQKETDKTRDRLIHALTFLDNRGKLMEMLEKSGSKNKYLYLITNLMMEGVVSPTGALATRFNNVKVDLQKTGAISWFLDTQADVKDAADLKTRVFDIFLRHNEDNWDRLVTLSKQVPNKMIPLSMLESEYREMPRIFFVLSPHLTDVQILSRLFGLVARKAPSIEALRDQVAIMINNLRPKAFCTAFYSPTNRKHFSEIGSLTYQRQSFLDEFVRLASVKCLGCGIIAQDDKSKADFGETPLEALDMLRYNELADVENMESLQMFDSMVGDKTDPDLGRLNNVKKVSLFFLNISHTIIGAASKGQEGVGQLAEPFHQSALRKLFSSDITAPFLKDAISSKAFRDLALTIGRYDCEYFKELCSYHPGSCHNLFEQSLRDLSFNKSMNRVGDWKVQIEKMSECIRSFAQDCGQYVYQCNQDLIRPKLNAIRSFMGHLNETEKSLITVTMTPWISSKEFQINQDPAMYSDWFKYMTLSAEATRFKEVLHLAPREFYATPGFYYALWVVVRNKDNKDDKAIKSGVGRVFNEAFKPTPSDLCFNGRCSPVNRMQGFPGGLNGLGAIITSDQIPPGYKKEDYLAPKDPSKDESSSTNDATAAADVSPSDIFIYEMAKLVASNSQHRNLIKSEITTMAKRVSSIFHFKDLDTLLHNIVYVKTTD